MEAFCIIFIAIYIGKIEEANLQYRTVPLYLLNGIKSLFAVAFPSARQFHPVKIRYDRGNCGGTDPQKEKKGREREEIRSVRQKQQQQFLNYLSGRKRTVTRDYRAFLVFITSSATSNIALISSQPGFILLLSSKIPNLIGEDNLVPVGINSVTSRRRHSLVQVYKDWNLSRRKI